MSLKLHTELCSHLKPEKKWHRLRKNRSFQQVYQKGRYFSNQALVLYCLPKSNSRLSLMGFAVARKTGNAPKRNRLRRQLREITRINNTDLPAYGYDLILMSRLTAINYSYLQLTEAYLQLLQRMKLWLQEKAVTTAKGRK